MINSILKYRLAINTLPLVFGLVIIFSNCSKSPQPPNVVLLITDDQGYGDLSCHGNPVIETPNIDALYEQSVRFTDFHVDPTCAPTRAALMTGKYAHHAGVWHTVSGGNHLRDTEVTMADIFKSNGYRTGLFGKWHLGSNYPYRPIDRGFDEWLGHGDGGTGTTDDWYDNDRVNDFYWHNGERIKKEGFAPDVFFEAAINFIKQDNDSRKPFFLYLATYLPHDPHTLPDRTLAKKYNTTVSEYESYFFAGIDRIDKNIGKLHAALERTGKADHTILIFMTDNGGTAGVKLFNAGMRGRKGQVYEGGHRVPFFIQWPAGNLEHGKNVTDLTAHIDVLPTLIDLCNLSINSEMNFDGRSFREQLFKPHYIQENRTLFVETQRTFKSEPWIKTAGMTNQWRLVDNNELYDLSTDPGQTMNIIGQHPEVVAKIQEAHEQYWALVTPGDRDVPRFIVGHPNDTETFLHPSDWYLPEVPWNHAQVAEGSSQAGTWNITIAEEGLYRFEVRRWPREAQASIKGTPTFKKVVDAWSATGEVERFIYGNEINALPINAIALEVGNNSAKKQVGNDDSKVTFEFELVKGNTQVKGIMLDDQDNVIAGAYYVYITRL